jgi:hypothetical protein
MSAIKWAGIAAFVITLLVVIGTEIAAMATSLARLTGAL